MRKKAIVGRRVPKGSAGRVVRNSDSNDELVQDVNEDVCIAYEVVNNKIYIRVNRGEDIGGIYILITKSREIA